MSDFTFHSADTAPEAARDTLQNCEQKLGFVPNLYAGLASAPPVLDAYIALGAFFDKTSLTMTERQVVLLTTSVSNGCEFCVAAHSMIAKKMAGVQADVVDAIRAFDLPVDSKLAALATFTRAVVEENGWVADHPAFQAFLDAGYTRAQALEVVLGVAQKTLSNYTNHLMKPALNPAFADEEWSRG